MRPFLARGASAALAFFSLDLASNVALGQMPNTGAELGVHALRDAIDVLVRVGDPVPGLGRVAAIGRVAINDAGSWLVEVRTDHPDPGRDEAILHDGRVAWTEGQTLSAGGDGPRIRRFDAFAINAAGDTCWAFALDGTPGGTLDDSAFFFNSRFVLQEGQPVAAAGIPSGTSYRRLMHAELNGAGDALLVVNLHRAPGPETVQRALFHFDLDGAGTLHRESAIAVTGNRPDALNGDALIDIDAAPHTLAFNAGGSALYVARASETAGGRYAVMLDDAVVAREGAPFDASPEPGRSWRRLQGTTVALNDAGSVLFRGSLDGDTRNDDVLVLDGRVLAREGDVIETIIGAYPIRGFAYTTPLAIGNDGDTLYFAFLDKPGAKNVVAMLDGRVVLQEGVTPVDDTWIESLIEPPRVEHAALSPDASKLVLECLLFGRGEAALRVDLTRLAERFCNAADAAACPCVNAGRQLAGCDNAAGTGGVRLRLVEQRQEPLNRATMVANGFEPLPRASILLRGDSRHELPRVFGDGVMCLAPPLVRLSTATSGGGLSHHRFGHGRVAGAGTFHYQVWYADSQLDYCDPTAGYNLSSGRSLSWQ